MRNKPKRDCPPRHPFGDPAFSFRRSIPPETMRERMAEAVEHARAHKPYVLRMWEKKHVK
jgi:hypothetical protein